jgi:hypothetical protein
MPDLVFRAAGRLATAERGARKAIATGFGLNGESTRMRKANSGFTRGWLLQLSHGIPWGVKKRIS